MPDIRLFQQYHNRNNPFAKYDYMGVTPYFNTLNTFLITCEMFRSHGIKMSKERLENERKAFLAIKNGDITRIKYEWEDSPTDFFLTTDETWYQDTIRHLKETNKNG